MSPINVEKPVNTPSGQIPITGSGATFRPGDMFNLRLTGMPAEYAASYALDFTIGGDGFVNIPLGGQVRAAGLTQSQLERAIERKLIDEKIFRWPTATINVNPGARFVTIGGNVRQPNRLQWTADLTILSAISACGGSGDFAGNRVNLIRSGQVQQYDLRKLKKNPADDPRLNPGDQVDLQ
jgi:polysaccharide export outer membrane protein